MTTSVNLINQIKRVLNRHSEDPYFGNLVSALQNVSSNSDIDDVIYETADSLCPIYYAELKVWIPEHIDEINDCVKEYVILPEDFDLFNVAQKAWVKDTEARFFEYCEDACLVVAFKYLAKHTDTISYKAFSYLKNNLNKVDISTVQDIIDTADKAILP